MTMIPAAAILSSIALHVGARENELDELYQRLWMKTIPDTPSAVLAQVRAALAEMRGGSL